VRFQFFHKEFIWLFIAVAVFILLFVLLLRWKRKVIRRMGDRSLVKALISTYSPGLFALKFGMLTVAFAAGVVMIMDLRKPGGPEGMNRKGIDVVIALDVSKSMLATDLAPNRLERAKQLIGKLMNAMPNDRIGLVLFAGKAYLQMPLTTDHGAAMMFVNSASPDAVPQQGTVISEAIQRSANAFNAAERRFKAVLLISDGEDHDPEAVNKAKELAEHGMMINTVGVGSPDGSYIPDPITGQNKVDPATGSAVISKLNEDELKQIAANTNGIYIRLQDSDEAVRQLQQQLSQIESKAFADVSLINFKAYYWWFAGAMLILLLAEYFIPETKKVKA
jgi:Ca-activated chloride channel homolog